jgi:uncharacterized protein (DUF2141 family)
MIQAPTLERFLRGHALPIALLLASLAAAGHVQAAEPGSVELTFQVGEAKGEVLVALYDSQAAYEAEKPSLTTAVAAGPGPVIARFTGVKSGRYAAKALHDLDGDRKMGVNMMGIPTEPFAFSNNAKVRGGPASWSDASFEVGADGAAQTIVIP